MGQGSDGHRAVLPKQWLIPSEVEATRPATQPSLQLVAGIDRRVDPDGHEANDELAICAAWRW
jgi:hypothetical protein